MPNKDVTKRFAIAAKWLLDNEKANSQTEISHEIKWAQSSMNQVMNGNLKREIPLQSAITFCDKYYINKEWLIEGKGGMLAPNSPYTEKNFSSEKDSLTLPFKSTDKDEIISYLQSQLELQKLRADSFEQINKANMEALAASHKIIQSMVECMPFLTKEKSPVKH